MIVRQARMIFSAYRKDDFADPDGFVLQLGMVLERYPDAVIIEVSSPLTGIQRRHKNRPPDIAAIVEACDDEIARVERIKRLGELRTTQREPRPSQHPGNLFVAHAAPGYELMVEMAKRDPQLFRIEAGGIWAPLGLYEANKHRSIDSFKQYTEAELLSLYGRNPKAMKPTGAATRAKEEAEWYDFLEGR